MCDEIINAADSVPTNVPTNVMSIVSINSDDSKNEI